jgi:hypothetical protein
LIGLRTIMIALGAAVLFSGALDTFLPFFRRN